jgi:hypothetical protein
MERYSDSCEQRYRQQFAEDFDFIDFSAALIVEHCSDDLVIAFDPSYIPKAGKHTFGKGKFWSGCAGVPKWGLEINGIAAIDLDNHTAMHIEAVQTCLKNGENLLDFYANILIDRQKSLFNISKIVVVDAYFSKEPFVKPMVNAGFTVVSRLRKDANMTYLIKPERTGRRGRPKTNGGKIDVKNIDTNYFHSIESDNPKERVYTAVVKSVALNMPIRVVIVQEWKNGKASGAKIYFSTDIEMSAERILHIYRSRFQIEFLYRDAKQFTGLNDCQARSKEKLYFHFNISLTAVSVAKAVHWFSVEKEHRGAFSMADIKTINHNALLISQFFTKFGINPNIRKNKQYVKELLIFGTIAA